MKEIVGLTLEELQSFLKAHQFPVFRAKQMMQYIYKEQIYTFPDMVLLPKDMRQWLGEHCTISIPHILDHQISDRGDTIKLLLELEDMSQIETVMMRQSYGLSICVSSQVGCAMGCTFCASTQKGLYRNLEVHEIVGQALAFTKLLKERIHSLVVMGAGEPLDNYDNVIKALRFFHREDTFSMSYRKMTLSSCGIVEGIHRLSREDIPITLALSLHAPNDKLRQSLMPIGKTYVLQDILTALLKYFKETNRKITFEYIMIKGINDSLSEAKELSTLLENFKSAKAKSEGRSNINIIPVNGNAHNQYERPSTEQINKFVAHLEKEGYTVIVRKEMGHEIQAACGQLKADYERFTSKR